MWQKHNHHHHHHQQKSRLHKKSSITKLHLNILFQALSCQQTWGILAESCSPVVLLSSSITTSQGLDQCS